MVISRDFLLMLVALLMILVERAQALSAELGRQGHDRHADHHRALRPLREPLGLAAADPPDRVRRRRGDHDRLGLRLRLPGRQELRDRSGGRALIRLRLLSRPGLSPLRADAAGGGRAPRRRAARVGGRGRGLRTPSSPAATATRSRSSSSTTASSRRSGCRASPAACACAARPDPVRLIRGPRCRAALLSLYSDSPERA